jgi:hypothetical protein
MFNWRRKDQPGLPISSYLEGATLRHRVSKNRHIRANSISGKVVPKSLILGLAIALTATGVVASVAITIRGNSSTEDGVVSLGVGQAAANSCNTGTTVKTDTISQWDDTYGDFTLQRVNVSGVKSACQNNVMTLVLNITGGADLNVNCSLPASSSLTYEQATFVFTTSAFTATAPEYSCGTFTPYPKYMASISAAAVQIK